jgi:hypothetical protein
MIVKVKDSKLTDAGKMLTKYTRATVNAILSIAAPLAPIKGKSP